MKTSLYAYKSNADFWWKWLDEKAPNGSIKKLKEYLEKIESSSDAIVNVDGKNTRKRNTKIKGKRSLRILN
ncbi:MAG: hypothetical protein IJ190_14595 [Prevotella sp.]|nr:hypothetical protein [Prevotella sp.]